MWHPLNLQILDKVCLLGNKDNRSGDYIRVGVSAKVDNPPLSTLAIVKNKPFGGAHISGILCQNTSYYGRCFVKNLLPFEGASDIVTDIKYWALNDMVMCGLIGPEGQIKSNLVFVTYSGHSSVLATSGKIYKKLVK